MDSIYSDIDNGLCPYYLFGIEQKHSLCVVFDGDSWWFALWFLLFELRWFSIFLKKYFLAHEIKIVGIGFWLTQQQFF